MDNYIDNLFHFYETPESFQEHLDNDRINPDSICFIDVEHRIFAQGKYFGIDIRDFEDLSVLVGKHTELLNSIIGGDEITGTEFLGNLNDIIKFLEGFTTDDNLKDLITSIDETLSTQIGEVSRDLQSKYDSLVSSINTLSSNTTRDLTSINSKVTRQGTKIEELESSVADNTNNIEYLLGGEDIKNEMFNAINDDITSLRGQLNSFKTTTTSSISTINSNLTSLSEALDTLESTVDTLETDLNSKIRAIVESRGEANGLAPLDENGLVPSAYLPSYVDDVLEFESKDDFPTIGETGKIYVDLDENLTYRWSGTTYVEISKSIGLGETVSTAYPGNKGKQNADNIAVIQTTLNNKVDKVEGKGLSTNDYTNDEKSKLSGIESGAQVNTVNSVAGKTGSVTLGKSDVGLNNVDNTSDINKPISTATQTALDDKVDKVTGKGLSSNDFTSEYIDRINTAESNIRQLEETKADVDDLSNVIAEEVIGNPLLEEINTLTREEIKKDLFIDMWNESCGEYGTYNAETGFFELNGLKDITYVEAIAIYNQGRISNQNVLLFYGNNKIRTHLPPNINSQITHGERVFLGADVESVYARLLAPASACFKWCSKLKSVFCWGPTLTTATEIFLGCSSLVDVDFASQVLINLSFADSPLLSDKSINNIIKRLQNGRTITVHPDVYAKLTDETNEEWYALLGLAATKNILFATA